MIGFHPAKYGRPRPFRSRVKSRHGTDRRTDIPLLNLEYLLTYGGGGIITDCKHLRQELISPGQIMYS